MYRCVISNVKRLAWRQALQPGLAVLQLFLAGQVSALDPGKSIFQFNCRNWTRQNGLPVDKVSAIAQDKDGYLWLGTQDGLVCFNGLEFSVIPINLPSAQGHDVEKLITSHSGDIEFTVKNGGFGSYNGRVFSSIGDERWTQTGAGATMIMEARDGAIWTGAAAGFGRWLATDPAGSFFSSYTNYGTVYSACEDASGRIWLGTGERGLLCWEQGHIVQIQDGSVLRNALIFALVAGQNDQIWIGTTAGLYCYTHGRVEKIYGVATEIKALLLDRHGVLWVGTGGSGLGRYENGNFDFLTKSDGLVSNFITSLFEDAEGSLWVGTVDGVSQLSDLKFPIISGNEGICVGSAHEVCASKKGGLWIGLDNGLSYFDGRTAINFTNESVLPNHYIKLCFEARNGEVYVEDGDKTISILAAGHLTARLTNSMWVSAFAEDSKSVLAGIGAGDSLYRVQNGKIIHYTYPDGVAPEYYWINNLCVAKDDTLWVASQNGIYHLQSGGVKRYGAANGLGGDNALWIFEDVDGSLWAGLATGIARIKNGVAKSIKPENGLADTWICSIVPDDYGYFWFSSSRGIFRATRKGLNDFADGNATRVDCELFNGLEAIKSTGRTDQENSGCKTSDGRIWFPCPWGVVMINPGQVPVNQIAPPVQIYRVLADGKELPSTGYIVVPPGKGQLEFRFDALSFISPEKIQFRYQLEGFDNDWVNSDGRRQAFYANLRPGRYVFRVSAANADGIWNQTGSLLHIELRPHFRQTLWFQLLCGSVAVAALAGIYAWRIRHLEFKQRALQKARDALETEVTHRTAELARRTHLLEIEIAERERMQHEIERVHLQLLDSERLRAVEAERSRIAQDLHDDLGSSLTEIGVLASTGTRSSGPEENSSGLFQTIGTKARLLIGALDVIVWAVDPEENSLQSLADYLSGYVADFLNNSDIACRFRIPVALPDTALNGRARHDLFLAIKEVLHNIVQHARATEVEFKLGVSDSSLEIVVTDNGCGFVPGPSEGHGLKNLVARLAKMRGYCTVTSRVGQGTQVRIQLPLGVVGSRPKTDTTFVR